MPDPNGGGEKKNSQAGQVFRGSRAGGKNSIHFKAHPSLFTGVFGEDFSPARGGAVVGAGRALWRGKWAKASFDGFGPCHPVHFRGGRVSSATGAGETKNGPTGKTHSRQRHNPGNGKGADGKQLVGGAMGNVLYIFPAEDRAPGTGGELAKKRGARVCKGGPIQVQKLSWLGQSIEGGRWGFYWEHLLGSGAFLERALVWFWFMGPHRNSHPPTPRGSRSRSRWKKLGGPPRIGREKGGPIYGRGNKHGPPSGPQKKHAFSQPQIPQASQPIVKFTVKRVSILGDRGARVFRGECGQKKPGA